MASTGECTGGAPSCLAGLVPASRLRWASRGAAFSSEWGYAALAGRLVELSGWGDSSALTAAFRLLLDAQEHGEPSAWVSPRDRVFFPPDAADAGVDLRSLVIVFAPSAEFVPRAADRLARSGAFGLIVLDLAGGAVGGRPQAPLQKRLAALAEEHDTTILCLTRKRTGSPSMGPLVSLHAEARVRREGRGLFACEILARKDRRGRPQWRSREICRGPAGLC